ncbi:MAG: thioredoxin domain-containing protein [Patescibacteria group bacterium]|jgi:protein-disulfide isomerase
MTTEKNSGPSERRGSQSGGGILDAPPKTTFFMGLFLGVAATALIGLLLGVGGDGTKTTNTTKTNTNTAAAAAEPTPAVAGDIAQPNSETDYYLGEKPEDADIVMVEYSDYQCTFCERHHPTLQQVVDAYDGQISWVYRHFPLDSIHPNATPAALAAECVGALAGNQEFWDFTSAMFENQSTLGDDLYLQEATALGVSESAFTDCYDNREYLTEVQADTTDGSNGGVTGTPGTIIMQGNDVSTAQLVSGALPYESIVQVIDGLL